MLSWANLMVEAMTVKLDPSDIASTIDTLDQVAHGEMKPEEILTEISRHRELEERNGIQHAELVEDYEEKLEAVESLKAEISRLEEQMETSEDEDIPVLYSHWPVIVQFEDRNTQIISEGVCLDLRPYFSK